MTTAPQQDSGMWNRFDKRDNIRRYGTALVGLAILIVSWRVMNVNYEYLLTAHYEIYDLLYRMVPPDLGYVNEIASPLIETIHMSIMGTALSIIVSVPIAYLAANNVSPHWTLVYFGKFIISVTRSISAIIWALIFVVMFGPGALAGIFALAVRSIGFIGKLLSEAIEEIDPIPVEAVTATGGNKIDVFVYGIVPQIKPAFIGMSTYRWDINIRQATVLGLVGAGGIGLVLDSAITRLYWPGVTTILLSILLIVIFSEGISAYLRKKIGGV
ncbi:phosphonate ABC transporter, permease protein PhnE [Natrarchaeobius chitinivorans]|uniref:Phosphonate ABC transporter, permease protein PhnE n=1 Tax=Natrarchaeobius chitinivorans TaxID=1679083 RepID=A0A3N6MAW0_NATCH|nr:phosphonate ABC transporter, permease protein PhnE [Natrarchaeobius chitinivorans]RQG93520.1 phosphonate ABC transporter, permease protein PhnE [Natrarchaeobius chitinivorans]